MEEIENFHGDQIKNVDMGDASGSYRGEEGCIQGSAGGT